MNADLQTQLNPEQCWRIYSRLEEMSLKLAKTVGIEERELERYYVPLCQNDESTHNLKRASKPEPITKETAMRQFARSLQNGGPMTKAVGFKRNHEHIFKEEGLLDADKICVVYGDGETDSQIRSLAKKISSILEKGNNKYIYRYAKGLIRAAQFLKNDGLNDINIAIRLKEGQDTPVIMNEIANKIRRIYGMGIALPCDFLKECGCIWMAKPDVHLIPILMQTNVIPSGIKPNKNVRDQSAFCTCVYHFAVSARTKATCCKERIAPYKIDKMIWLLCTGNFYLHERRADVHNLLSALLLP